MPEPLLTADLIGRYERCLEGSGVPLVEFAEPGLSDAEMASLVEPLPLALSTEAKSWWSWQNGSVPGMGPGRGQVAPGVYLVSLERAVSDYHENRLLAEERSEEGSPDSWWDPEWIPILSPENGTTIGCDCSVPPGSPSPLYVVWWKLPDHDGPQRATGSLGQMVEWWIEAINTGIWQYDRDAHRWHRDYRAVPRDREGIV